MKRLIFTSARTPLCSIKQKKRTRRETTTALSKLPKWPDYAVVFGCESRTGITQELTFGFYRILKLNGDSYVLEEEGGFFDDDLPLDERKLLGAYFRIAVSDKTSFPPNFPRLFALGFHQRRVLQVCASRCTSGRFPTSTKKFQP